MSRAGCFDRMEQSQRSELLTVQLKKKIAYNAGIEIKHG
jgi:hypothetical protein